MLSNQARVVIMKKAGTNSRMGVIKYGLEECYFVNETTIVDNIC